MIRLHTGPSGEMPADRKGEKIKEVSAGDVVAMIMLAAKTYRNLLLSDTSKPKLAMILKAAKN